MAAVGRLDAEFKARLQVLRRTDNVTNFYYIARTYAFLFSVIAAAVGFDICRQSAGWSWTASAPVYALVVLLVGVGQHHLSGLAHEGSHHILFRNRELNELASDLFCLFPLFSSTYHYRLQHLAHHQFVNDPERDPDVAQLESSGHRLTFPLARREVIAAFRRQLRPLGLVRYVRARAEHASAAGGRNPYAAAGEQSKVAKRVAGVALLGQLVAVSACVVAGSTLGLAVAPPALFLIAAFVFWRLPKSKYIASKLRPVIGVKWMAALRVGYIAAVVTALGWAQLLTGCWAVGYFIALWVVPLVTSFSLLMLVRQTVQHGNGDGGRMTNTRVFFVNDLLRVALFPAGQGYHLPHHLYATVPHFRLAELHAELLADADYRAQALEVHGVYREPRGGAGRPTIVDVLGPDYAPRGDEVYIDDTVLDDCIVEDRAAIGVSRGARSAA